MKKRLPFILLLVMYVTILHAQSWKAFNILSGNPNATGNEIRFLNGTTGCLGSTIATTNGIPTGNNNLPYGAAFDPTEGKLYYSKAGTTAGTSVFNVYNNTGATATNTNLGTISGGEYFRMGVGQDGNVYGTVTALVIALSASAPRIDIQTVKLTRYNPNTNTFTVLGNIQCPSAYSSTMPAPYNTGDYWSSSDATTTPFYAAQLGSASYGDLVIAPDNTMYVTIGKKLIRIPNYSSVTGTTLIPTVEVGNILPTGVGFNFTTQGSGTYGISWDYTAGNLMLISSRASDGSDGSYNANPATGALVGSFRVNCLATPTSANFADLTSVMSSIGAAKQLTAVQFLGYNNRYRLTYRIRVENIGGSILKTIQSVENVATAFPSITISNVSTSFVSNPASLVLNPSYNGTTNTNLFDGTKTLYGALYKGANLNGGAGTITAGSNFAVVDVTFDVAGVATNGTTTYTNTATATGTGFDATTVTDNSDNGTTVETGTANQKADDAGEGDATPIKFGSTVSGTVWNDINNSANNTLSNIFTTGESGTNAGGLNAILIDPITNLVIASVSVAANGTYSFANVPSFANLQVRLSTTAGTAGSAPPAESLPTGWVATSPRSTNTTGDINTGTYNAADASRFGATDDPNNDFGIQRLPESAFNLQAIIGNPGGFNSTSVPTGAFQTNNVGATPNTQDYDGGTVSNIRVTSFPTNANSITINGTIYTNGGTCPPAATCIAWPVGGVTVPYTNGTGPSQAISVDPVEGNVDVVISFASIDNAGKEDATPGSVTIPFRTVSLTGTVFNDANGNAATVGTPEGGEAVINGTNAGGGLTAGAVLYANLIDPAGNVIATVAVLSDGTYTFPNVPQSTTGLTVQLSTNQGTVGIAKPATAIPSAWTATGENKNGQAGAADATTNSEIPITTVAANITSQNFGIQRLPETAFNLQAAGGNPGGFNSQTVPAGAFQTNNVGVTPNTQDYNGGTVTNIRITAFPTNANSITINGTVYTNGGTCPPATSCTAWPALGVTVPYTNGTGPTQAISVDPVDGNVDVVIPFASINNTGKEDATPGSVTIPFRTITLAGTVWNDLDGNVSQNGAETVINGTNAGGGILTGATLYANLVDPSGNVIASVPVSSTGTYNFPNVPQSTIGLTVQLSTNQGTVGLAKPATSLPTGWAATGENKNGQGGAADATANSEILVTTVTTNITLQNFGIQQLPESAVNVQMAQNNPGGTQNATVPTSAFQTSNVGVNPNTQDYNGGTVNNIRITSFPTGGATSITIGTTTYYAAAGDIPGTCPTATCAVFPGAGVTVGYTNGTGPTQTITIDPLDGVRDVVIPFVSIDNAGKEDPTAGSVTMSFTTTLAVKFLSFVANKVNNNTALQFTIAQATIGSVFTIERSITGSNFIAVGTINSTALTSYAFTDYAPVMGSKNYYRIKEVDAQGRVNYSEVKLVKYTTDGKVDIYPIPAATTVSIVLGDNVISKSIVISLYNSQGQEVMRKQVSRANATETFEVANYANGTYQLRITSNDKIITNQKVVIMK
jgi:Secretion system C-terminal sorting domain